MTLLGLCRKKVRGLGTCFASSSSTTGGSGVTGVIGGGVGGGTSLPQSPGAAASPGSTSDPGGSHAVPLAPVCASTSSTATTASTKPAPTAHEPKPPTGTALPSRAVRTASGPAAG